MAFSKQEWSPKRWWEQFLWVSGGANGAITDAISPGKVWRLREIRVHCSTAFASAEYLRVYVSSVNGSQYNTRLISQAMNTVQDLWQTYGSDTSLTFLSDDTLVVSLSLVSGTNVIGINVGTWAAIEGS